GYAVIDKEGLNALGLVVKLPSTQPATQPTVAAKPSTQPVVAKAEPAKPTTAPVVVASKPSGEVRIDKLLISGLDAQFEDRASDPPMMIPLNGLDVEVRDFSTLAPYEDRPIKFSAVLNAGKVKLRKPEQGGGIIGVFSDLSKVMNKEKVDTT